MEEYSDNISPVTQCGKTIPVLALGVGNPLMGDDGLGVELAKRLLERPLDPLVHVEDGGTLGMTLLPLIEDADTVILMDAVKTGAAPGTIVIRTLDELPGHFSKVISPHQIGIKEVLGAAQLCGAMPRCLTLIGVEAANTDFCAPMSDTMKNAIPTALAQVEKLIRLAVADYKDRIQ